MSYAYREAYTEVYYILKNKSEDDVNKIPVSVLEMIKRNRVRNYIVNIDASRPLKNQTLKEETKAILAILYRKFLCDEDEREALEKRFLEKLKEETEMKAKKDKTVEIEEKKEYKGIEYSPKVIKDDSQKEIKAITEYKVEKWYSKLFNKIRLMFKNT